MKSILKLIAIVIGILALLFVLVTIGIATFVSPNNLKPMLTAQVKKYTGRELTMDGDLSWSFFPTLSIKTGHMTLSNPAGFQQPVLAEIQEANISVHLLPLLRNKIRSDGMTLHGLKLYLIKNAKGQANWDFSGSSPKTEVKQNEEAATSPASALGLAIVGIDVTDGQVMWIDEQSKQSATIKQFDLHAKDISFVEPFPLTVSFAFSSQNPTTEGQIKINGHISANLTKQIFSFRALQLDASLQQENKRLNMSVTGDVIADLSQQTLKWSNLRADMGKMILTGKLNVTDLTTHPQTIGHLEIQPVDLRAWLNDIGEDVSHVQAFKTVTGDFQITTVNNTAAVEGKLSVDEVQANNVKLTHVNIPVRFQNKIVTLSNMTADFYQGTLKANTTVNLQTAVPHIAADGKLNNVQAGPLLDDLGSAKKKIKFSGLSNIDFQVTTAGLDGANIVKNLNGNSHFSVANGTLEGIDIRYYINVAKSLLAQHAPTATNTNRTEFANLTASAIIKNGVVQNDDLLVMSSIFTTKGKGVINLVNQQINYHLDTLVNKNGSLEDTGWADLTSIAIPVTISGSLADPAIRLDSGALTKAVTSTAIKKSKDELKEKIKKQGGELLQNLLNH